MKFTGKLRNSIVFLAWCFLVMFSITFNNHSNWILLFFISTLLLALIIMLFLPLSVSLEGLTKEITLAKKEPLEIRVYTRTIVRFRFLNVRVSCRLNQKNYQSKIKMLPTKKHQILNVETQEVERGIYTVKPIELEVRDFIGLLSRKFRDSTLQTLVVCPEVNASGAFVADYLDRRFNIQAPYKNRETFDVKLIREYIPGDRMNRIDWKLTSKTDALIYREYTHENDKPVIFIYVGVPDEYAEWMLSLIYTLDTQYFNGSTIQFGLLGRDYIPNPALRDYSELEINEDIDTGILRHDAILFTPKRLNLNQNIGQIYCDHKLVIFEQGGKRDIVGEFNERGELI